MFKKNKKKIIFISLFILGIVLIIIGVIINHSMKKNPIIENPNEEKEPDDDENLLGMERLESQKRVTALIEGYIKQIPNLEEYLQEHDKTSLTLKEVKEDLGIDTTEIEKLEYGCNLDGTMIDFQNGINDYKILIACDIFLLKWFLEKGTIVSFSFK